MPAPSCLFCFGCGYTASALARARLALGWRVGGTIRDPAAMADLLEGVAPRMVFDGERPLGDVAEALRGVTHILVSVPPGAEGDPVLKLHGADIAALPELQWLGYLSTTGVYGDTAGQEVDEGAPLNPSNARSRYRVAAEEGWLDLWRNDEVPVHVFRLAGIYGPGRSALDNVRAGRARRIDKPGHAFSRIHVEDIVTVLEASMARPNPGGVYNVCDDEAAPGSDVVEHACHLLGHPVPPLTSLDEAGLSDMARSFYADNRRVSNVRIKAELGVALRYPTYREGLAAILDAGTERPVA